MWVGVDTWESVRVFDSVSFVVVDRIMFFPLTTWVFTGASYFPFVRMFSQ